MGQWADRQAAGVLIVFYIGKGHSYISSLIASLLSRSPIMHFLALLALIGTAAAAASPGICEYKP